LCSAAFIAAAALRVIRLTNGRALMRGVPPLSALPTDVVMIWISSLDAAGHGARLLLELPGPTTRRLARPRRRGPLDPEYDRGDLVPLVRRVDEVAL